MSGAADIATKIAAVVFVTTSMASAGLAVTPRELGRQWRRPRLVVPAMLLNFVGAPLLALGLCRLIPVHEGYATGLLLLSGAAGAPFLPKLAEHARASQPMAVALMMLLLSGTILFLPLAMPRLVPGLEARPLDIVLPLAVFIGIPLAGGMAVLAARPAAAARAEPILRHVSDAAMIVFIVLIVATHSRALFGALGSGAILTAMLFVVVLGAAGYATGGPSVGERRIMSLASAQRNVAAAIITAGTAFAAEPRVIVMILVTDIVAIALLFAAVARFRKSAAPQHGESAGAPPREAPARG